VEQLQQLAEHLGVDRSTLLKQVMRRGYTAELFDHACNAYRRGEVTLSRAAEMAHLSLRDIILRLRPAGLELNYGPEDLKRDLDA